MKVVSLFAGVGGLDLGFKNHDFQLVWANDFDKDACATYKHNLWDHIVHGDITQINSSDIPDCDIVIGGSPCFGFSNANRRTNFLENPHNLLVREYIRIVLEKNPKVFILENVPQILTAGDGQFMQEIIDALNQYHIEAKILNAADYGVPQARKRAIIIGSRIGKIVHPVPTIQVHKTVKDALEGLSDDTPNQNDKIKHSEISLIRISCVKPGENIFNIPETIRPQGGQSCSYKRLEWDKPSITMVNIRKNMILHPLENRALTVREAARIQSFPDSFVFVGKLAAKHQQVANAVPPLLSDAIAKQIKAFISN